MILNYYLINFFLFIIKITIVSNQGGENKKKKINKHFDDSKTEEIKSSLIKKKKMKTICIVIEIPFYYFT